MRRCTPDSIPKRTAAFGSQMRGRVPLKIGFERNNFTLHVCIFQETDVNKNLILYVALLRITLHNDKNYRCLNNDAI